MLNLIRKYSDFAGRTARGEFWLTTLLALGAMYIGERIDAARPDHVVIAARMGVYELGAFILFLLPLITAGVRRLHDTNRSGWWLLLLYAPYVGWILSEGEARGELFALGGVLIGAIALTVIFCLPGDRGENRFGPSPKGLA
jgi:uncharacterized membrane protein YhaH (DUF805 family)